ncbi:hypothetical protein GTA51_04810 [Desulfovibrio aerotolerans]|uniref:Uncharacterized protein n=1 Tax=Solidesulfovibrio aerotolerans TaxID=295255 RepID=A0A7C9IMI0_9BACT|nr:hypothetical protein [Solidesulfovibrio aerotolerans]MYL82459.1 hypothetical protein [Solidesulfovibrio aerotolerans]
MTTLDKYNVVFNILQDKLNQLSENNNEISCGIDQIEGIWHSNANTVNSITNQMHLNGDKFVLLISKKSLVCHTIKYGTGFKITLTPENIIFTFTSNFLRKIGSPSVTIKCVQYFFSSTGIDYTTDYIEKKLQTNYVESYTDILSTPTVLKDLNKLCKLIHTDLLGEAPPPIKRIKIDQLINHRSAQDEIQARAGDNLKLLQPFYSENENGEIKKMLVAVQKSTINYIK